MEGGKKNLPVEKDKFMDLLRRYSSARDLDVLADPKVIINLCLEYAERSGQPFEKNSHGFSNIYEPVVYFIAYICKHYFNYTYRQLEKIVAPFYGSCPDFSVMCKMLSKKAEELKKYTKKFFDHLSKEVEKLLKPVITPEIQSYVMSDSTGFGCFNKSIKRMVTTLTSRELRKTKEFRKFHLIIRYLFKEFKVTKKQKIKRGLVIPLGMREDGPYSSDSGNAMQIMNEFKIKGKMEPFLADPGFDTVNFHKHLQAKYFKACIKLKNTNLNNIVRKKAGREFRKKIYRNRGIVEAPFGWLTNAKLDKIRERKDETKELAVIARGVILMIKFNLALRIALKGKESVLGVPKIKVA